MAQPRSIPEAAQKEYFQLQLRLDSINQLGLQVRDLSPGYDGLPWNPVVATEDDQFVSPALSTPQVGEITAVAERQVLTSCLRT